MESSVSPQWLEQFLHEQIPLSRAMQVCAIDVRAESVRLSAPLEPNLNHRTTVFGGSASAIAMLAACSLLQLRLQASFPSVAIVIQRQSMSYNRSIHGMFTVRALLAQPEQCSRFVRLLARRGRARITITSTLDYEGEAVGLFLVSSSRSPDSDIRPPSLVTCPHRSIIEGPHAQE